MTRYRPRYVHEWPPARTEEAARLWAEGWTASQIAERLEITRNQLIGKANRRRDLFPRRKEQAS